MSRSFFTRIYLPRRLQPLRQSIQAAASVPFHETDQQPKWCLVIGSTTTRSNRKSLVQMERQENSNAAPIKPSALTTLINPVSYRTSSEGREGEGGEGTTGHCNILRETAGFAMRTTAISLAISHSACGVQRTWEHVRRISTHKPAFSTSSLSFYFPWCSSRVPSLSLRLFLSSIVLLQLARLPPLLRHAFVPSILSLYIQPVDLTSVLRTLPDRVQDIARPVSRWAGPSPSNERFILHANPVASSNSVLRYGLV